MTAEQPAADTSDSVDIDPVDMQAVAAFDREYPGLRLPPVAVVIAAYDEEGAVGTVLRGIPEQVAGLDARVIVVVDGATDGTAAEARAAGALVCDVPVNRGQGAALRLGYLLARRGGAEYIATTDADGQYDPEDLHRVVAPLVAGEADFVSGSRVLGKAQTTDRTRRLGVTVFAGVISVLTGQRITDPANGLRAMRAEVTGAVRLRQPQYQASELLISAMSRGYRVAEVPTTMRERSAGETKKGRNLLYGARFGRVVVTTWWRERRSAPAKITSS
jgi:glycosyltransferase involved in cell wall biosynthesis